MDDDVAIEVNNLTKSFRIPHEKAQTVKGRILGRGSRGYSEFTPLDNISFTVNKGDFFGVVGRNGSGKSTLLRTIAGVYQPTGGAIHVNGSLIPFIELGVGFNHQLTGRENVYLNAALLGIGRDEVDEIYDDIVDFAELREFMDERLQNYSSGMQVRLAFSIAIRANSDILLLDEVLAVGDTAFQEKCFDYFRQIKDEKRTMILVTHSMGHVEEFCNRGLLLEDGEIKTIGSNEEVAAAYNELFKSGNEDKLGTSTEQKTKSKFIELLEASVQQNGKQVDSLDPDKNKLQIAIKLALLDARYSNLNVSVEIRNQHDILILFSDVSKVLDSGISPKNRNNPIEVSYTTENILGNGRYRVAVKVIARNNETNKRHEILNCQHAASFRVEEREVNKYSLIHPEVDVKISGQ